MAIEGIVFIITLIVSLVGSILITRFLLKRWPRVSQLVLYVPIALYLLWFVIRETASFRMSDFFLDPLEYVWVLLLIPFGLLIYGVIVIKGLEKKWKYTISIFFGGWVLFILYGIIFYIIALATDGMLGFIWGIAISFMIYAIIFSIAVAIAFIADLYFILSKKYKKKAK